MSRKKISIEELSEEQQPQEHEGDENAGHPAPEEVMLRQAERHLTAKQRKIWELYSYDKLSQRAIAKKLGKRRSTVQTQIKQCEAKLVKWCKMNMETYKLIKNEMEK